jgi:LysM repeat protein
LFLPALTLLLSLSALSIGSAVARRNGPPPAAPITSIAVPMTIQPGDSLWTIARRYGNPHQQIVERVEALAAVNGLSTDSRLHPGNRLLVRVENPTELALILAKRQAESHIAVR